MKTGVQDYVHHLRLFSRNARLYLIGSFLMGVNFHVFQLLLNLYLKQLGFDEGQIGYVVSSRAIGMTLIAIPAAMLMSRIRLKPLLLTSCVLFAVFSFFIATYQALTLLIGFSILSGMAFSFYRVAAAPFYMRNSTPAERTHLFSFSFGMMLLAGMAGSIGSGKMVMVISGWTGDIILGYQITLYIGIAVALAALIPFFLVRSSKPSEEERRISLSYRQLKERGRFYFKITISNFIIGAGAGLIIPFLNLYFRDRFNLQPDTIGFYYFVVQLSMLAGSLSGPLLVKRFGLVRTVVITQIVSLPFMLILSYTYFLPLAFVAFVLRGGLMNLGIPLVTNLGMEVAQKKEQGLVNALLMVAWTSAWMISAAIGGTLIEEYGYTITMNITVVLYVISTITYYGFFRKAEAKGDGSMGWVLARDNVS
ncbi:MAG: MFS transporter [Candidatus Zixiibacteriota bacterium]|nr:MAG: MFS transporter [candidate division Zixibacteria bacterium]